MATVRYEGSTWRTYGDLPAVGSHAPDVSLVNTKLQDVTLANFMGKRKVFNIFVSIDRSICAKSVVEFDRYAAGHDDVAMLAVSYDLPFAHKRFQEEHDLRHIEGLSAIRHASYCARRKQHGRASRTD
jgi:thiol peroxidase